MKVNENLARIMLDIWRKNPGHPPASRPKRS